MSSIFKARLSQDTQSTATLQPVPYSSPEPGRCDTDPDLSYNPVTQTLSAPNIAGGGMVFSGDIEFTNDVNHSIIILPSDPTDPGRDLLVCAGDGGDATALLPGGVGGSLDLCAGEGGDGSAAQAAGGGGTVTALAGDAGADNGGGGGTGGDFIIDAGSSSAPPNGAVSIGETTAEEVNLGRNGKLVNIGGALNFPLTSNYSISMSSPAVGGGDASDFLLTGANGGGANAGTPGGDGSQLDIGGGNGGAASAAQIAGDGGGINLNGGDGGNGTAAQPAGVGGDVNFLGGNAGADLGGGGNNGGNARLDAGPGSGAGLDGEVLIGDIDARGVAIGHTGIETQVNGVLRAVEIEILDSLFNPLGDIRKEDSNTQPGFFYFKAGSALAAPGGPYTGGSLFQEAGVGSPASAAVAGGDGGTATLFAGNGGPGSAAQLAGIGGSVSLFAGNAGANGGAGGNTGGEAILDAGTGSGAALNGPVNLGTVNAETVNIGRVGKRTSIKGALKTDQGRYADDTAVTVAATPYAALGTDDRILVDASGGAVVVNLPDINTVRNQILYISKTEAGANTVTVNAFAGQTIGGGTPFILPALSRSTLQIYAPSAGTDWVIQ